MIIIIILEGPDGAGKTTLLRHLQLLSKLPIHARASDSIDGPVPDIFNWANLDVNTWADQRLSIYDRHPLISELIYGPITRDYLDPRFLTAEATHMFNKFYKKSLIILCMPPFDVVSKNVHQEGQMAGVLDNLPELYDEYTMLLRTIPLGSDVIVYDYTSDKGLNQVIESVENHKNNWISLGGFIGN